MQLSPACLQLLHGPDLMENTLFESQTGPVDIDLDVRFPVEFLCKIVFFFISVMFFSSAVYRWAGRMPCKPAPIRLNTFV